MKSISTFEILSNEELSTIKGGQVGIALYPGGEVMQ
ncbi:lactococcin family bacteriocin [Prolixibacter sp. SD074]|jgi:bacteriocin-like protein|nr:lactococcin family bacteriocin [Prolixibacter sp. SD074]